MSFKPRLFNLKHYADYYNDNPYIVLQMVVTAGVLQEGKQSLAMPTVGGTLLGQEKGGVPKLI